MYPQHFSAKSGLLIRKRCSPGVAGWPATGQLALPGQVEAPPAPEGALWISRLSRGSGAFS